MPQIHSMMIENIDDLIDALGGTTKAAKFLDVTKSAVSHMKRSGRLPYRHVIKVQRHAQRKRWKLADTVFEV